MAKFQSKLRVASTNGVQHATDAEGNATASATQSATISLKALVLLKKARNQHRNSCATDAENECNSGTETKAQKLHVVNVANVDS